MSSGEGTMTTRDAIKILIESPIYFRLAVADRLALVQDFREKYLALA